MLDHASGLPSAFEGAQPTVQPGRYYRILRASPVGSRIGLCINRQVFGAITHYVDRRTLPCTRDYGPCSTCVKGLRVRWYGYMPVVNRDDGKVWLAELTLEAAATCPTLLAGDIDLRGMILTLTRRGKSERSPVVAEFSKPLKAVDLPPTVDVRSSLFRLWGALPSVSYPAKPVDAEEGGAA